MERLLSMNKIKQRIVLRFIIVSLISLAFLIYRFIYDHQTIECIRDSWHQLTNQLNSGLDRNGTDDVVIGIGQVFMDFWIVALSLFWFIKIKNSRIAFAAGLIFLIRAVMLNIIAFPFPLHLIWHNPGFFSITVPYDRTRDFYYSGHTATLTIIILQFYTLKYKRFTIIPIICLIYMISMLIVTRVHYTIDIAGGLIYALFLHKIAGKYTFYMDWIFSIPYCVVMKIVKKYQQNNRQKQTSLPPLTERILPNSQQ